MSSQNERTLLDAWRLGWPFPGTIGPYVILAVLAGSAAVTSQWGSVKVNLALCAVAAVWLLIPLHPALQERVPAMAVFLVGLIAITAVLVIRDPWFGFFVVAGYGLSVRLMPWPWQLPCMVAFGVLAATAQMWGVHKTTPAGLAGYLAVIAVNVLSTSGLVWILHSIERAHDQRKGMVDELSEANHRLEATLAENEGLHRQLVIQAREAGILDERQRMAREIHDTLAQGLTGIIAQLQAADHAAGEPAEWRRHFAAATRLARESLAEARRSVDALRPEPLETAPLGEALAEVAARWSALHDIPAWVATTGEVRPIAPDAEAALLRTAQEALANVAKHAQATRVGVTLSYLEDEVALDVRDDGKGFDPAIGQAGRSDARSRGSLAAGSGGRGGFGLIAMRQRIEGLAGTLQIESESGAGTGISAHIPAARAEVLG